MKVLVLCHANRWRSPLCAALLRKARPDLDVLSAGFKESGHRAALPIREVGEGMGVGLDLAEHRSTKVIRLMVDQADLVIYMDGGQRKRLLELCGKMDVGENDDGFYVGVPDPKWKCLAWYVGEQRIPDPAFLGRGEAFTAAVQLIARATAVLAEEVGR